MLKTLIDFFLLISSDKKKITCTNISAFYQFITKKIIDIENQRPFIIINSLSYSNLYLKQSYNENISSKNIDGFIFQNDESTNKTNRIMDKNIAIKKFQKELISLFNDMIDFIYEEKIVILREDNKIILINKINNKLKDKNIFVKGKASNYAINDIKKIETRNYIIELINNNKYNDNFISFNFTIKNFIDFFNTKNRNKNRYIAEQFVKAINPIIKIYKNDKKLSQIKKINKTKTRSLSKIPIIHIDTNDLYKAKISNRKKNYCNMKYKMSNSSKNNVSSNSNIKNYVHKGNYSFHKKKGKYGFSNLLLNKNKRKTENYNKSKISKKNSKEQNDVTHDTIQCQTLNNCNSFDNIQNMYKIENILYNNIKTNSTHINGNKIKIKSNRANSKNIVINEIRNFYSNSQIDYFKNKNKSSITTLYDNDIYDLNKNIYKNCDLEENCNLKTCNIDTNVKNRESKMISTSQKEEELNEKGSGCFIY